MLKKNVWKAAGGIGLFGYLAWNEFRKFKKELEKLNGSSRENSKEDCMKDGRSDQDL